MLVVLLGNLQLLSSSALVILPDAVVVSAQGWNGEGEEDEGGALTEEEIQQAQLLARANSGPTASRRAFAQDPAEPDRPAADSDGSSSDSEDSD